MIQISTLEGDALDYWVAKAQGCRVDSLEDFTSFNAPRREHHRYSTNPAQGQPIMERAGISVGKNGSTGSPYAWEAGEDSAIFYGPTILVAAMRAYLYKVHGGDVIKPTATSHKFQ